MSTSSICQICEFNLTYRRDPYSDHHTAHTSRRSFCKSLRQGCPLCWILWRNIRSSPFAVPRKTSRSSKSFGSCWTWTTTDAVPDTVEFTSSVHRSLGSSAGLLLLTKRNPKVNPWYAIVEAMQPDMEKSSQLPFNNLEYVSTLSDDQSSDTSINQIRQWINTCVQGHHRCLERRPSSLGGANAVPTRLIDLGTSTTTSNRWSLVLTDNSGQDFTDYAALSHRWTEGMPKLTQGTLHQISAGESDNYLPKHFQDVFGLCRKLSIRYIWIDSLCIFQDSEQDFQKEAATMTNVYMNALCTFSICWASKSQGCLPRRDPQVLTPVKVRVHWATIIPKNELVSAIAYEQNDQIHAIENSEINSRGWVFQEKILSPRILFLGNEQMYWQCDCLKASEVFPLGLPKPETSGTDPRSFIQLFHKGDLDKTWNKLVRMYSETEFTYEKDRLVAISGLIRVLAARVDVGPYLAGIWRRRWIDGLLWQTTPVCSNVAYDPGTLGNNCPSWSWASSMRKYTSQIDLDLTEADTASTIEMTDAHAINCPGIDLVEFNDFQNSPDRPLARLSDSRIELQGDDEYGSVKFASIDITGFVIPVWLPPLDEMKHSHDHFQVDKDTIIEFKVTNGEMMINLTSQCKAKLAAIDFYVSIRSFTTIHRLSSMNGKKDRGPEPETNSNMHAKSHRYQSHRAHLNLTSPYNPARPCFLLPLLDARETMEDDALDYIKGLLIQEKDQPVLGGRDNASTSRHGLYTRIGTFYDYPRLGSLGKLIINTILNNSLETIENTGLVSQDDALFYQVTQYLRKKYGEDVNGRWEAYTRREAESKLDQCEVPFLVDMRVFPSDSPTEEDGDPTAKAEEHPRHVDEEDTNQRPHERKFASDDGFKEMRASLLKIKKHFQKEHDKDVYWKCELDAINAGKLSRWNRWREPLPLWGKRLEAEWKRVRLL
ncbi:heterokaryon incompatibility protein-domain-containing protein [Xylaria curta]|nr:heterokaryon incompatibility protein-domain-containing protein [Xylaria curta]